MCIVPDEISLGWEAYFVEYNNVWPVAFAYLILLMFIFLSLCITVSNHQRILYHTFSHGGQANL